MKTFFDNPDAVTQLHYEAKKWIGTPWLPNSAEPGKGVSCHNLPRAIYISVLALPVTFPSVIGDPTQDRYAKISRMETFLDARPEFMRVALKDVKPGDLLGIRIYYSIDHLAVALGAGLFIHVLMHKHTSYDMRGVEPWSSRIQASWRIK